MPPGTSTPCISGRYCELQSTCSGGNHARLQDLLVVVDVVDEGVQRPHPLFEPRLQAHPFLHRQDPGHDVEGDQPLGTLFLAIDREGDAHPMEQSVRLRPLLRQTLGGLGGQPFAIPVVVRARSALRRIHLVIRCGRQTIPLKTRKESQAARHGVGLIMYCGVWGCNAGRGRIASDPAVSVTVASPFATNLQSRFALRVWQ